MRTSACGHTCTHAHMYMCKHTLTFMPSVNPFVLAASPCWPPRPGRWRWKGSTVPVSGTACGNVCGMRAGRAGRASLKIRGQLRPGTRRIMNHGYRKAILCDTCARTAQGHRISMHQASLISGLLLTLVTRNSLPKQLRSSPRSPALRKQQLDATHASTRCRLAASAHHERR